MAKRIQFENVTSGNLTAVGYNPITKELHLKFHYSGSMVYVYADVSKATHRQLMSADSIGSYFHTHIRYKKAEVRRYHNQTGYIDR